MTSPEPAPRAHGAALRCPGPGILAERRLHHWCGHTPRSRTDGRDQSDGCCGVRVVAGRDAGGVGRRRRDGAGVGGGLGRLASACGGARGLGGLRVVAGRHPRGARAATGRCGCGTRTRAELARAEGAPGLVAAWGGRRTGPGWSRQAVTGRCGCGRRARGELWTCGRGTAGRWGRGWSPDGSRLASAGGDGTVRVWEASSGGA